jgi:hypothetical protein
MDDSWIQCGFELGGQRVHVAVRRLGSGERVRLAAEIAWFADALTSREPVRPAGWPDVLDRILTNDVAITCHKNLWDGPDQVRDELVCRAFQAFVTANQLSPGIREHLQRRLGVAS